MIYEFESYDEYRQAFERDSSLLGPSPGGAASQLGITRQGVDGAVRRGSLDMVRIVEGGSLSLFITTASIERYRTCQRPGRAPSAKQKLKMSIDKHVRKAWPE